MSDLEQILARARDPGRLSERRHFTLSRAQAIEKLRDFTLRRPGQAVLELIQGAVFAGASYIAVDTHPDRVVVAWVGTPPLSEDQLEHLFDYLFADRGRRDQRHLVQLAVAVNAMLSVERGQVRVESGSGRPGDTLRLDLESDGTGTVGRPEVTLAGTYVAMARPRKWWRFWDRTAVTEEQVLVEEQCRYTPVPILLNGSAPFGYRASRQIRAFHQGEDVQFDAGEDGRRGSLYLTPLESRVDVVVGGVRVTTLALDELGEVPAPGSSGGAALKFSGVVCDDHLRKTADQSDIVRDDRYTALLEFLRGPATQLAHRQTPGWTCPLPVPAPPTQATVELPAELQQLAPRPPLALQTLTTLPTEAPLFWVEPHLARNETFRSVADPTRLPYPIVLLSSAQAQLLESTLGRPVGHLTDAAAVDLAVRAASGSTGLTALEARTQDAHGRTWRCLIGAEHTGIGLGTRPGVCLLVVRQGITRAIHTVDLAAPGLTIVVEGPFPDVVQASVLRDQVLRHAVRSALTDAALPLHVQLHLTAAVLRVDPAPPQTLRLSVPPGWVSPALPVSLELLAQAATDGVQVQLPEDVLGVLDPLVQLLGPGVVGSARHGSPIAATTLENNVWQTISTHTIPSAPCLVVWSGPSNEGQRVTDAEPLLTVHNLAPEAILDAAASLCATLQHPTPLGIDAAIAGRVREALAHHLDQPQWSTLDDPRPLVLRGGPRAEWSEHIPISWTLARASGRLSKLAYPPWAADAQIDGGWQVRVEVAGGWLGIPRTLSPRALAPRVLVDTGLDRAWVSTRTLLPCVGIVSLPTAEPGALWPALVSVWLALLQTPPGEDAGGWVLLARQAIAEDSLMGARLAQWLDGLSADRPPPEAQLAQAIRELDRVAAHEPDLERLLQGQRRALRAFLGQTGPAR